MVMVMVIVMVMGIVMATVNTRMHYYETF
jgi:hypothetical protein